MPVYLICASGNRSLAMTNVLVRAGYDAYLVIGGTCAWTRAGSSRDGQQAQRCLMFGGFIDEALLGLSRPRSAYWLSSHGGHGRYRKSTSQVGESAPPRGQSCTASLDHQQKRGRRLARIPVPPASGYRPPDAGPHPLARP